MTSAMPARPPTNVPARLTTPPRASFASGDWAGAGAGALTGARLRRRLFGVGDPRAGKSRYRGPPRRVGIGVRSPVVVALVGPGPRGGAAAAPRGPAGRGGLGVDRPAGLGGCGCAGPAVASRHVAECGVGGSSVVALAEPVDTAGVTVGVAGLPAGPAPRSA